MQEYIVKDSIVYKWLTDPLFRGYIAHKPPVLKADPWIAYQGPKRKLEDWRKVLAFFLWSFKECEQETQVRWYLNLEEGLWKPWAFPQEYNTGMSAREIPERCDEEREKAGLDGKWCIGGTDHHHCKGTAWQSPTDKTNETTQNGLHITVGKLDEPKLDIHGRAWYKGTFYDPYWTDWFEMPPGLEGLPPSFEQKVMEHFLTERPPKDQEFPVEWKANVIKKVWVASTYKPSPVGNGPLSWHGSHWGYGSYDGEVEADANEGKAPKAQLSRKDKKRLNKALGRRLAAQYNKEDLAILTEAAKQVNLLLASSKGVTLRDLVRWSTIQNVTLDAEQDEILNKFDDILHKTGADYVAVLDWIATVTETESSA